MVLAEPRNLNLDTPFSHGTILKCSVPKTVEPFFSPPTCVQIMAVTAASYERIGCESHSCNIHIVFGNHTDSHVFGGNLDFPKQSFPQVIDFNGAPGWIRTSGLSLRRRTLYPTELRERVDFGLWILDFGLSSNGVQTDDPGGQALVLE